MIKTNEEVKSKSYSRDRLDYLSKDSVNISRIRKEMVLLTCTEDVFLSTEKEELALGASEESPQ